MNQKTFDVIVAGGGTAGAIAGLAAARNGARTLIVEKNRCLGGQFTAGMMGAWVGFSDKLHRCVGGIAWELRNILNELGAVVERMYATCMIRRSQRWSWPTWRPGSPI